MPIAVAIESPDQPDVRELIAELDAYQGALYPPESNHGIDVQALMRPQVLFAVARDETGAAVGCGAIVLAADHGELKRMYVKPAQRGRSIAAQVLQFLEAQVRARGLPQVLLETGPYQPEALRFYEKSGYTRRGPFADYWNDPLSVFMEKTLAPA